MKKAVRIFLKITGAIILVVFVLLLTLPVLFKGKIKEQVVKIANDNIEAEFMFNDFSVSLIRHFPNFTFSIKDVYIVGINSFEGDTLAGFNSFSLVFDLSSIIGKKGYNIKSIIVNKPLVKAVILADGTANWDIMKDRDESSETVAGELPGDESASSGFKMRLQKFEISNGIIEFNDYQSDMSAGLEGFNMQVSGNMSAATTDLAISAAIEKIDVATGGISWLKSASVGAILDVSADLENNSFLLGDNELRLNDILLSFSGLVSMDNETIKTDLAFETGETGFKQVLSMVPALYMEGYEDLETDGTFGFSGKVNGIYNSADSIFPDLDLDFYVKNGIISYPDLPAKISEINIRFNALFSGSDPDRSEVNLEKFHFELAGNPFDMNFSLRTPLSDPAVMGAARGKIDLGSLADAVPVQNIKISGLIEMAADLAGNYSMIEREMYDKFRAGGKMIFTNLEISMDSIPPVRVESGIFNFSPQYLSLDNLSVDIAGSDFLLKGRIEDYIPYLFRGETVTGLLTLNSNMVDAGRIMSFFPADTTEDEVEDTQMADLIKVPANIDFTFNSRIASFIYPPLEASDIRGNIIVRDGTLKIEDTGLQTLGGRIELTALYDTRDTLNPVISGSLTGSEIGIKAAFETFNTVKKLAPVAEGMDGDINVLFEFSSTLGKGMMPVIDSISGKGRFDSEAIELVSSPVFEKFSTLFKLDDSFSNVFKDVEVEFRVDRGRVYIKPFNTGLGVIKMNIGGDHGLDQSLNYTVKSEMPVRYLPESMKTLINNMAAQAALLGINYQQPEVLRVNMTVGGTVKQPVIVPSLSGMGEGQGGAAAAREAVREAAGNIVEDAKAEVSEEIGKQAAKIIAEAEEKAELVRTEAAVAAQRIRDEAEKNAQKLIDEASTKGSIAKLAAGKAADALRKEADKKAVLLVNEADAKATAIVEEAKKKAAELNP